MARDTYLTIEHVSRTLTTDIDISLEITEKIVRTEEQFKAKHEQQRWTLPFRGIIWVRDQSKLNLRHNGPLKIMEWIGFDVYQLKLSET